MLRDAFWRKILGQWEIFHGGILVSNLNGGGKKSYYFKCYEKAASSVRYNTADHILLYHQGEVRVLLVFRPENLFLLQLALLLLYIDASMIHGSTRRAKLHLIKGTLPEI